MKTVIKMRREGEAKKRDDRGEREEKDKNEYL